MKEIEESHVIEVSNEGSNCYAQHSNVHVHVQVRLYDIRSYSLAQSEKRARETKVSSYTRARIYVCTMKQDCVCVRMFVVDIFTLDQQEELQLTAVMFIL